MKGETLLGFLFIWGSAIAWDLIMLGFLFDCARVHRRTRREYRALGAEANGRKVVARGRYKVSLWFMFGVSFGLTSAIIGTYRLTLEDLNSAHALLLGSIGRTLIILAFLCFWGAKRTNLNLYERAKRYYRTRIPNARN